MQADWWNRAGWSVASPVMPAIGDIRVIARDGRVIPFDTHRIAAAIQRAFDAGGHVGPRPHRVDGVAPEVDVVVQDVVAQVSMVAHVPDGVPVERIQNMVEEQLVRRGHYSVASQFMSYRDERAGVRPDGQEAKTFDGVGVFDVHVPSVTPRPELDDDALLELARDACCGFETTCTATDLTTRIDDSVADVDRGPALVRVAVDRIETDVVYERIAARLQLALIYRDALGPLPAGGDLNAIQRAGFKRSIILGVAAGAFNRVLLDVDLDRLVPVLDVGYDARLSLAAVQTMYDVGLAAIDGRRIETPQMFFLRSAIAVALAEVVDPVSRALDLYGLYARAADVDVSMPPGAASREMQLEG